MKIDIQEKCDIWQDHDVNVIIGGLCQHNRITFDRDDDNHRIIVCERCDAWKYEHNELDPSKWYDEFIIQE